MLPDARGGRRGQADSLVAVYQKGGVGGGEKREGTVQRAAAQPSPATSFGLDRISVVEPPTFLGAGMAQPGMGDASLAQIRLRRVCAACC